MKKLFKISIGILTVLIMLLQTVLPVDAKKYPCCSCCADAVCKCGCNKTSAAERNFQSPQKNSTAGQCDFNPCNQKTPSSAGKTFVLNSTADTAKKKLVLGFRSSVPGDKTCLFSTLTINNDCGRLLSLPPPLFLKNSSLLL